ncbi:hypothetical protein DAPPUDRAFT_233891 [Daphnia pulex]|uniref:Uncharacterized protein n=1 Tax=Daphnia pulex TaxID=6669 RepID=E9FW16_DAPPU|nr:hypothetical protein DAPPUDRAFT_233891 [Daphnia pulex]|eukprot:EFX88644.1 hypothetical protein DAPPUDRAFT_233891 [Daphnia pulex]
MFRLIPLVMQIHSPNARKNLQPTDFDREFSPESSVEVDETIGKSRTQSTVLLAVVGFREKGPQFWAFILERPPPDYI